MTSREARRQRREAERKALKSAKGADARRQPREEHAQSLGGSLDSAPVLRAFPQPSRKAEAAASQIIQPAPVPSPETPTPQTPTPQTPTDDAALRAEIRARIDLDNQWCEERLRAETNRKNSLHSTGPRTPAGKLASSRNSFKHGLYSKALVLPSEDPAELDALKADLRAEHRPADTTEEILVNELAEHFWRLRRMRRYETEALVGDTKYDNWFSLMALIQRTMASAERGFHKALTTLRQMQKARGFVPQDSATAEHERDEAAVLSEPKTPTKVFVPQKAEFQTAQHLPENPRHLEQHELSATRAA